MPRGITSRVYRRPRPAKAAGAALRGIAPCGVRTFLPRRRLRGPGAILRPSRTTLPYSPPAALTRRTAAARGRGFGLLGCSETHVPAGQSPACLPGCESRANWAVTRRLPHDRAAPARTVKARRVSWKTRHPGSRAEIHLACAPLPRGLVFGRVEARMVTRCRFGAKPAGLQPGWFGPAFAPARPARVLA